LLLLSAEKMLNAIAAEIKTRCAWK